MSLNQHIHIHTHTHINIHIHIHIHEHEIENESEIITFVHSTQGMYEQRKGQMRICGYIHLNVIIGSILLTCLMTCINTCNICDKINVNDCHKTACIST